MGRVMIAAAALPVAGNVYILAQHYGVAPQRVSSSILISTAAAVVTLPVVIVGFFQWGMPSEFYTLCAVYLTIQVLDGNVLVPLLFSEAVNLHPVAILMAVLFFGGIWGLWGVFLATLIKAVINAWPSPQIEAGKDVLQDPME